MQQGYIKLYRKITQNAIFNDFQLYRLWSLCLLNASYKEREVLIDGQLVKVKPGQWIVGRFSLFDTFNNGLSPKDKVKSEKTPYRWLEKLEKLGYLELEKTNKYTVVNVVNWGIYQSDDAENVQQIDHQMTNKRPTKDHQMTTNKKVKNIKNDNNISSRIYEEDSDEMILVDFFIQHIRMNDEKFKDPNKQKWADEFRKLIEVDKRDRREVARLIKWVQQDDFWKSNILSPTKLRKQYSNLLIKMNAFKPVTTQEFKSPKYVNSVSEKDLLNMGE